ncbi:hypothetical protein J2W14_000895 [Pseudarthrobacter oxydans]|uniref:hypothetical protein n=1 Tax=Pseudarthrobacter oxydans TaxID=1671 RepID=UPI00278105FB|nr:hypothetical protein [Pseudarthrobacter oxydans]MDP9981515.1 hypothetical protein [Pseudarthrobacter oxydans]
MWIVVLLVIGVVVALWQVILAGLVLWAFVACIRWWIAFAVARPSHSRRPVQTRPVAKPVQSRPVARPVQTRPASRPKKPEPVRELPSPDYLPRWTASRRLDTGREHAQWQETFDNAGQ